jgi:transposase
MSNEDLLRQLTQDVAALRKVLAPLKDVDLSLMLRQQREFTEGLAQLRVDYDALLARTQRIDAMISGLVDEVRAMHVINARTDRRLLLLENSTETVS